MSKTTLINLRTYRGPKDYVLIDRRTIYGNKNQITPTCSRKQAVEKFRTQFDARILTNPSYRQEVEKLRGKKIACWCTPLPCHGDVYISYFERT